MSLSWFTTIPGLLITGGVLLLLIALVIFIVTSVKDKNKLKEMNKGVTAAIEQNNAANAAVVPTTEAVEQPQTNEAVVEMPQNVSAAVPEAFSQEDYAHSADISNIPDAMPAMETPVVNNSENFEVPVADNFATVPQVELPDAINNTVVEENNEVSPYSTTTMENNFEMPSTNIEEVPVMPEIPSMPEVPVMPEVPTVDVVPTTEIPVPSVEQVVPEMQDVSTPTISIDVPSMPEVAVEPVVAPVEPVVEETPVVNEVPTTIYGGASPVVPNFEMPTVEHQIYGGANPLENTQSVSISDITNSANTSIPVEMPTAPEVKMPEVNVAPEIKPIDEIISTPSESAPVEMPVINEMPSVAVQEPTVNNNTENYQSITIPGFDNNNNM